MAAVVVVPVVLGTVWILAEAGGQTRIDPATLTIARLNAGGPITAITGTEHTVYHANDALPDAKAPRADGRPTLIWFTNTACAPCEQELFVHAVAAEFRDSLTFVEKEGQGDRADAGRSDAPTFVFIDELGNELKRFGAVATDAEFKAQIEAFLAAR